MTSREAAGDPSRHWLDLDEMSSEALISVHAQLVHRWFGEDPEQRALALVSPDRGDGRSFLCAHLGRMFAELEDETLIIDADLRHPRQHEIFGLPNSYGLADALKSGFIDPPVQFVAERPGLHVLTAGTPAEHPHALLSRRSFSRLLERFAGRYRVILLDTPSMAEGATDALTVSIRASAALLVVRRDRARMQALRDLAERLQTATVELLGAVMNQVPD